MKAEATFPWCARLRVMKCLFPREILRFSCARREIMRGQGKVGARIAREKRLFSARTLLQFSPSALDMFHPRGPGRARILVTNWGLVRGGLVPSHPRIIELSKSNGQAAAARGHCVDWSRGRRFVANTRSCGMPDRELGPCEGILPNEWPNFGRVFGHGKI
jgi:hypothetical protein